MENFWQFMEYSDWWVSVKPFIWYKISIGVLFFILVVLGYLADKCGDKHEGVWMKLGGYRCKRCGKKLNLDDSLDENKKKWAQKVDR